MKKQENSRGVRAKEKVWVGLNEKMAGGRLKKGSKWRVRKKAERTGSTGVNGGQSSGKGRALGSGS